MQRIASLCVKVFTCVHIQCVMMRCYESISNKATYRTDILLELAFQYQLVAAVLLKMKQNQRQDWVQRLWKAHEQQGHYANLVAAMRLQDHSMYLVYFRMLPSKFDGIPVGKNSMPTNTPQITVQTSLICQ